jgi:Sortase domain
MKEQYDRGGRPGQGRAPRSPSQPCPHRPMTAARRRGRHRAVWAGLAGLLAALGTALVVTAVLSQQHAPAPPGDLGTIPAPQSVTPASRSSAASPGGPPGALWASVRSPGLPPPVTASGTAAGPAALPRSRPVSLAIPAIGVHTTMINLGLGPGRTLAVPPLTQAGVREAGWYDLGPSPGQLGAAVIAGHVDSYQGPGVFFRLGALRPGNQIDVTGADGTVAVFRVDAVDEYAKDKFPTQQVYGAVSYAGLRVITCGGQFDEQTHHYLSNIVIYASLTGSRPSGKG